MSAVTRFQILRGTTAQRLAFIPLSGELIMDLENGFLYIGDGITFGGVLAAPLAASTDKIIIVVRNESGVAIPKGHPVGIVGATGGGTALVAAADAANLNSLPAIGLTEVAIPNNSIGTVIIEGSVGNMDTSAFADGDSVFVAVGGGLTSTKPVEPNFIQNIATVLNSHITNGVVRVQVGSVVDLPNLPNNHIPIGQTGGNTTTVDADDKIAANAAVVAANAAVVAAQADIDAHEARTDNPHSVTKAQVGLGNADNTSDVDKPVSTAQAAAIAVVQSDIDAHEARTDNPHSVTKAQVGLGNVDNTSDANKPVSTATQTALNLKYDASNPNGYETPAQLNARDTANRARANHTGTQLAATISDFAATVRSTVLTGLSLASTAAVVAADSILVAIGKLQAQLNLLLNPATTIVTATGNTTTTSTTDVAIDSMSITPPAGTYQVWFTTTLTSNTSGANFFTSIYSGGVQATGSQLQSRPRVNASGGLGGNANLDLSCPVCNIAEVTVNGSQAIEARWRVSAGTATSLQRSMMIQRVR